MTATLYKTFSHLIYVVKVREKKVWPVSVYLLCGVVEMLPALIQFICTVAVIPYEGALCNLEMFEV